MYGDRADRNLGCTRTAGEAISGQIGAQRATKGVELDAAEGHAFIGSRKVRRRGSRESEHQSSTWNTNAEGISRSGHIVDLAKSGQALYYVTVRTIVTENNPSRVEQKRPCVWSAVTGGWGAGGSAAGAASAKDASNSKFPVW